MAISTKILVRRENRVFRGKSVIHDYITTKVGFDTIYERWTHQYVAYLDTEESPYPFDFIDSCVSDDDDKAPYKSITYPLFESVSA